jgi:hypothetical protein
VLAAAAALATVTATASARAPIPARARHLASLTAMARAHGLIPAMTPRETETGEVARMANAGVRVVRLSIDWSKVAPESRPATFDASDPADPAYDWSAPDEQITSLVAAGFVPIADVSNAPAWATKQPASGAFHGPDSPSPTALAAFATAIAKRYGGSFENLPRVRYWQLYNEVNLDSDLRPQRENGKDRSPGLYRSMLNAFARAIHRVHADNLVITGGLTPFALRSGGVQHAIPPLRFMRELLCMSAGAKPHPTCKARVSFDVWSHHPYTSGGPTHKATHRDDVSLGDLPEMERLLHAAARAGHIVSRRPPLFWVTEFSWDSSPPDDAAVPVKLLRRWVPQAMYQMWRCGVSLVAWFSVRDQPRPGFEQSGLYFQDGSPKPYLEGFRFPVVAFPRNGGFYVWGRTPLGKRARVVIEQRTAGRWRRIRTETSGANGIFQGRYRGSTHGLVRARVVGGETSLPFSLASVPDKFYYPFGS